jgi:mono/diheme cytochrome c family protein
MRFMHSSSSGGRRMAVLAMLAALAVLYGSQLRAQTQSRSRGELLYNTNCVACHNEKMHWRGRKLVNDWDSLAEQVRRWAA